MQNYSPVSKHKQQRSWLRSNRAMMMPSDNLTTTALAIGSPIFGHLMALLTSMDPVVVTIVLFVVGKSIDVILRIYLERKNKDGISR
jgi:hypothetical protein